MFSIKRTFALGLLAVVGLFSMAYTASAHSHHHYVLPGDAVYPEGIAYDEATGDFYVSSTTDGSILRGNVEREEAEVFLPGGSDGRTTARGMKVNGRGRLIIAGGPTGMVWVYDTRSGALLNRFEAGVAPNTMINDIAVAPSGEAYVTDSTRPMVYRISAGADGNLALENWADLIGTPISYTQGFNLGGVDVTSDGRYVIVAQGNRGKLYRISTADKSVSEIALGSDTVAGADGIVLDGQTLYVQRNSANLLVTLRMSDDFSSGVVVSAWAHPDYSFPTTLALTGDRLLIVNSQFDKRNAQQPPVLPFKILTANLSDVAQLVSPGMPRTGVGSDTLPIMLLALLGVLMVGYGVRLRSITRTN